MSKNVSQGPAYRGRAWCLIKALFLQAEAEAKGEASAYENIKIRRTYWNANGQKKPKLVIENAPSEVLVKLIKHWNPDESWIRSLESSNISEILTQSLEKTPLQIYENLNKSPRGWSSKKRHFSLELWSIDLKENKKRFDEEWENPKTAVSKTLQIENIDEDESNHQPDTWKNDKSTELHSLNFSQHIPYKGVNHFVGRQDTLEALHQALHAKKCVAITAVAGMGGVGKTETAIQYAIRHEADYPGGYCWVNVRKSTLTVELLKFAQSKVIKIPHELAGTPLTPRQQVEWFWQNWKPPEGLVLVILDDVTDLEGCRESLPNDKRFRVLITTRLQQNLDLGRIEQIFLDVLSPEDALELLKSILGQRDTRIEEEPQAARDLCHQLGYLPLGLELVGYYLVNDPDYVSLTKILRRLKAHGLTDKALERHQATLSPAQLGVMKTFELSWGEFNPETRLVGCLLSLFNPDKIPWVGINSISELLGWEKTDILKAKNQLYKLHFIQCIDKKGDYYQIHPLIREFLRIELEKSEQADDIKRAFVKTFVRTAKIIPDSPSQVFIKLVKHSISHLEEIAKNLIYAVSDEDLIWIFSGLDRFYSGQGLYALAETWAKQCVSEVQSRLGQTHPRIIISLNNLASIYNSQGRYSEAKRLYQQALKISKRLLGEEHPDVASTLNNLASIYEAQGQYSEAEHLYQQALEMRKRLLGEEHPHVANSLSDLASVYSSQGRYNEAEPLLQQALEMRKRLLRKEHPHVANSLSDLASVYSSQGRYNEAEPLLQQALEMRKRLLGEEHPHVATSLNNLASVYSSQGRYNEAELLLQQALKMRKRSLGEEHPDVATSLNNLAFVYDSQGRYSEAEPLFQQALEINKRLLGEEHPHVAASLNNLASVYSSQGRYSEAEPLFQQALEMRKRLLGEEHPDVADSLNNLASVYASQEEYNEAKALYTEALNIFEKKLGEKHPNTISCRNILKHLHNINSD